MNDTMTSSNYCSTQEGASNNGEQPMKDESSTTTTSPDENHLRTSENDKKSSPPENNHSMQEASTLIPHNDDESADPLGKNQTSDMDGSCSEPTKTVAISGANNHGNDVVVSAARRRRSAARPSFDGNAPVGSYQSNSSRSLIMSGGGSSLSRPAGMRERMQQRLQLAQSERHLYGAGGTTRNKNLHNPHDDHSIASSTTSTRSSSRRLGMSSSASASASSVRDRISTSWSKVPSIRRIVEAAPTGTTSSNSGDDALLLQLTQKVRQLEDEKSLLVETQDELQKEHNATVERLKNKLNEEKYANKEKETLTITQPPSSPSGGTSASAMLELQAKLDKAMAKVSRLEEEQLRRDDIEEKYQDAQVTIANLRLQSTTTPMRRPSADSVGTSQSRLSDKVRGGISEHREDDRLNDEVQRQGYDEQRKAESPPSSKDEHPAARSRTESFDTTTTSASIVLDAELMGEDQQTRTSKLQKLKEFRRSRECQLKELVLDNQNSPTDVQSVIRNLQDELKAAKQVMIQQKLQLKEYQDTFHQQEESMKDEKTSDDLPGPGSETDLSTLRGKYLSLQRKYTQLEMDRAWGEFQLRDRITNDALKFHRRLHHWKEQTQELQRQLEETMEHQAQETKELRVRLSRQEKVALAAEQDLQEYKRGTEQTLKEFAATQDRLAKATAQLSKYVPERSTNSSDPTVLQQAHFLESAKERKEEKQAWSAPGWIGKIRHRVGEVDPSVMG